MKPSISVTAAALLSLSLCTLTQAIDVTKAQYDLSGTGANTSETVLTPANVNSTTFGKLFTKSVDGNVYAQPLYLQSFSIGGTTHNVVIVCTENNSIYAFDADNGSAATLWHRSLATAQTISSCSNISPVYGITATPVIDRNAGALYVEACTKEGSANYQRLFAINLQDGTDLMPSIILTDTVAGTGHGSSGGKVAYDGLLHFCRPGLLLLNGQIYIGSGSHCDAGNYHGWLFSYNASNLTLSHALCLTPNDSEGSIWQSGGGLTTDGTNIFCTVGNGSFKPATNAWGLSALKLDSTFNILSSFTPFNYNALNDSDLDLSSSVTLIPGSSLCTAQGKGGIIYVMDQNNLGGNHPAGDSIVQRIKACPTDPSGGDPIPVFWHNLYFLWAGNDSVRAFTFTGTGFSTTLQSSYSLRQGASDGGISLSANADSNGILWGTDQSNGHIYAFNASHVATMLWNDIQAQTPANRDKLAGSVVKFARPIVSNGKVYVGTSTSLVVYGLLNNSNSIGVPTFPAGGALVNNIKVSRHFVSLAFGKPGNYEILVSDLRGRIVASLRGAARGGSERVSLPGSGLEPGTYLTFVHFAKKQISAEAVVQ